MKNESDDGPVSTAAVVVSGTAFPTIPASGDKTAELKWFSGEFVPWYEKFVTQEIQKVIAVSPLYSFVIMLCVIDWLASLFYGDPTDGKVGSVYKAFVCKYLTRYDAESLYKSLRCGLVHLFGGQRPKYVMTHDHPEKHLTRLDADRVILNAEDFFRDIEDAKERYFSDVRRDDQLLGKLVERVLRDGTTNVIRVP
ncbi:MAG: hypothetical protein ACYDDA_14705 [Acidiferrobacteraceae bacterium]